MNKETCKITGRSKPGAKTAAAEAAIKHMVLSQLKTMAVAQPQIDTTLTENLETSMETDISKDNLDNLGGISWSHIASYALHKLLNSWDEDRNLTERVCIFYMNEKKPAKKMPENAASMNPIVLLNQMQPNAVYEESGSPPNLFFTIQCTVGGGHTFTGTGNRSAHEIYL